MGRTLFGTDGIRGIANKELSAHTAYMLGLALVKKMSADNGGKVKILIGKDTRASGDMLEAALSAGILAAGADAVSLGVVPTPAVAYLVNTTDAVAGVMISASHNPAEYNGLKVFASTGMKLPDDVEADIEKIIKGEEEPYIAPSCETGKYIRDDALANKYTEHVKSVLENDGAKLNVLFDLANGSATACAFEIFSDCGINADFVNCHPDGKNINDACGSTKIENIAETVKNGGYDIAFAFDGDADRCLCLDENGNLADGDKIISVIAKSLKENGKLKNDTAVVTCLSNMGMEEMGDKSGIKIERTAVGDRYVLERMLSGGFCVGGEQSGHIILTDYATTGDGEITAAAILNILRKSGKKASELFAVMRKFPQISVNVNANAEQKSEFKTSDEIKGIIASAEKELGTSGRIIVRPSGTEPLVRIMVEGENPVKITELAMETKEKIEEVLGK